MARTTEHSVMIIAGYCGFSTPELAYSLCFNSRRTSVTTSNAATVVAPTTKLSRGMAGVLIRSLVHDKYVAVVVQATVAAKRAYTSSFLSHGMRMNFCVAAVSASSIGNDLGWGLPAVHAKGVRSPVVHAFFNCSVLKASVSILKNHGVS
jgi:hypothetical protein